MAAPASGPAGRVGPVVPPHAMLKPSAPPLPAQSKPVAAVARPAVQAAGAANGAGAKITQAVSANDAKSPPRGADAVAKVAAEGKVAAPAAQVERAQKLAVDLKLRAVEAAKAIFELFQKEHANTALIHHETGAYPKDVKKHPYVSAVTGKPVDLYFRNDKLLQDAQLLIKTPLSAYEQAALPILINLTAGTAFSNKNVRGFLMQAEPGVHFDKSQIVHAQAIAALKKYPLK